MVIYHIFSPQSLQPLHTNLKMLPVINQLPEHTVMAIILEDKEEVMPRGHEDPGMSVGKMSPPARPFAFQMRAPSLTLNG